MTISRPIPMDLPLEVRVIVVSVTTKAKATGGGMGSNKKNITMTINMAGNLGRERLPTYNKGADTPAALDGHIVMRMMTMTVWWAKFVSVGRRGIGVGSELSMLPDPFRWLVTRRLL